MKRTIKESGSKRIVTSCSECHRRKQKCNRVRPCNFCSARNIPERCIFTKPRKAINADPAPEADRGLLRLQHSWNPKHETDVSMLRSLVSHTGYSAAARFDDFQTLQREIVHEHGVDDGLSQLLLPLSESFPQKVPDTYWEVLSQLPPEHLITNLLDFYFSSEVWSFPILDEHHFRHLRAAFKIQSTRPSRDNDIKYLPLEILSFPALLCSTIAIAIQFLPIDSPSAQALGIYSFKDSDTKSAHFDGLGQAMIATIQFVRPTSTSIQYYLSRSLWQKSCGHGTEAWQNLGTAIRQAQEIDLHRVDDGSIDNFNDTTADDRTRAWEVEHKKRLWARLFILDSHMAMALGRPRGIHREDCTTSDPLDCDFPRCPSKSPMKNTNHLTSPPSSFAPTMFWIVLSHKIHDMLAIQASQNRQFDYRKVETLNNEICCLLTALPRSLQPFVHDNRWDLQRPELPATRLRIATSINIVLLALHRPFVARYPASKHAAIEAAFMLLEIQRQIFEIVDNAKFKLFGYTFYTLDAGMFLACAALENPSDNIELSQRVQHALRLAIDRLVMMKERSIIAKTGELILRRCHQIIGSQTPSPTSLEEFPELDELLPTSGILQHDTTVYLQDFSSRTPYEPAQRLFELFLDESYMSNVCAVASG